MIISFYIILAFLLFVVIIFFYIKRTINTYMNEELKIIAGLKNRTRLTDLPESIRVEYIETLDNIIQRDNELKTSIEGIKEFRDELNITYDTLVLKSSQLEYSNQLLEMRVKNLSNLNQISRNILFILDIDKIIDTITDAYFVLTPTKRLSLYLWDDGKLINKKVKGAIDYKDGIEYPSRLFEKFTLEDFNKIYLDLSKKITVLNGEKLIISPLRVKNKELGLIITIHDKDKTVDLNKEMISALAIQASISFENTKNHLELLIKERISQELHLASNIQKRILPDDISSFAGINIATYFAPAKEIGGDYYDYSIKDGVFSISIADVSGKGAPAAFLMALSRSMLKTINYVSNYGPAEELNLFNKIIYKDITEDMFITILNAKYNLKEKTLIYSSAGHNPMVVYRKENDRVELLGTKGIAIGFMEEYSYRENKIELNEGDIVVFYTDGIIEAENAKKELFGIERLKDIVYKNKNLGVKELKEEILKKIKEFRKDHEQVDDITFLILKYEN